MRIQTRLFDQVPAGGEPAGGGGPAAAPAAPAASPSLFPAASSPPAASTPAAQAPAATPASAPAAAPAGTAPAWFGEIFTEDGKVNGAAFDKLPDNLKQFRTTFEQYKTPEALFHALGHTKQLVGQKALTKLEANAPQEARDAQAKVLREVLGVPEKPEGYGITKPEKLPEGVEWNDAEMAKYTGLLHKHNASPELVKELVALHLEQVGAQAGGISQAIETQRKAEIDALTKSLPAGTKFEDYMAKAQAGMGVASKVSGIPVERLTAMATNADTVKLLHAFAQITAEDKMITTDAVSQQKGYDEQIKAVMDHPDYTSSDERVRAPKIAEARRLMTLQHNLGKK